MITCIPGWATTKEIWNNLNLPKKEPIEWWNSPPQKTDLCIGWSLGGQIALQMASLKQCRACVLIATTPRQLEDTNFVGAPPAILEGMAKGLQHDRAAVLNRFFLTNLYPNKEADLHTHLCQEAEKIETKTLLSGLSLLQTTDLRESLSTIDCPCLILHGTDDAITPFVCAEYLAQHLPDAKLVAISEAGHALPITHLQEVQKHIQDFLNDLG